MKFTMIKEGQDPIENCSLAKVKELAKQGYYPQEDPVIFKWDKDDEQIVIFLPFQASNPNRIACFAWIGQHSEASFEYYDSLSNLPDDQLSEKKWLIDQLRLHYNYRLIEYQRLSRELIEIGRLINERS